MTAFPLLSDSRISFLWSAAHDDTTDRMAFQVLARAIESESRAPLLAEIERKSDAIQRLWKERDELRSEVERLKADAERLDYLEYECNELRTVATAEDDYEWVVISNHMDKPNEREVGRGKTSRSAIDAARAQGGEL